MIDEWFYKNYHKHREAIDKFWKERPEGMKLCPYCQTMFSHPGYPGDGSWTCWKLCFDMHNIMHSNEIKQDSISRLYLVDLDKNLDWAHELTLKNTEKKIHDLLEGKNKDV